jgi:hypothetical protein
MKRVIVLVIALALAALAAVACGGSEAVWANTANGVELQVGDCFKGDGFVKTPCGELHNGEVVSVDASCPQDVEQEAEILSRYVEAESVANPAFMWMWLGQNDLDLQRKSNESHGCVIFLWKEDGLTRSLRGAGPGIIPGI